MVMSPSGPERASTSMLSIPLKYTYLTKPTTIINDSKQHTVLYETSVTDTNKSIWRDVDTNDTSNQFKQTLENGVKFTDNLPYLRIVTEAITAEGQVTANLIEDRILENTLTINLSGPSHLVSAERAHLLRSYYQVERRHIGIDKSAITAAGYSSEHIEIIEVEEDQKEVEEVKKPRKGRRKGRGKSKAKEEIETKPVEPKEESESIVNPVLCRFLDDIAEYCGVSIFVTDFIDKIPYGISYHAELVSESASKPYHILIYGDQDSARFAELKVNIILEELAGKFVDSIPIDLSLQPLIAGPKLGNLKYIMLQTRTKIFTPDWLPELFASQVNNPNARNMNEIYITGQEFQVLIAKVLLRDVINKTQTLVKDCVISFAKIDLLSLKFQDELRKFMITEGAFIQIPYLGAARAVVRVQSTNVQTCNQTISQLMDLTSQLYNATFWIHTGEEDGQGHLKQPNIDISFELLDKISAASGATITCKNTSFDIIGFKSNTKTAVSMINSAPIWKDTRQQVRYRLELSNEQRDFIAGKKNGKIVRIMKAASVWIKLLPFNEYNFYVDLFSKHPLEAKNGLELLEEELSSELAFYIPETYHKKVIGAGGSTIQSIMRKYNVFIKFSSGFDCNPNGFTHIRSDNVLIRCPSKNAKEILPAKEELQETVFDRSQEHGNTFVRLCRSHMRILLTQQNDFVFEVENKTNTIIILPSEDSFEDPETLLEIKGVLGTSDAAARLIKAMLPEDYEFKVAFSPRFDAFVSEDNLEFFEKVAVPFRVALKIEVQIFSQPNHPAEEAPYHQIVLSFSQEHSVGLEDAIQVLTAYLRDKDLDIIDRGEYHVDPIVQGTAVSLAHGIKRRIKSERYDGKSRELSRNFAIAGFNPPTRPRNHDTSRGFHRNTASRPPTEPARMGMVSKNERMPYSRNLGPNTPTRSTYREPEIRQSSHPYRKQTPQQSKRTFRQSPQNNRFKYQPENDFDYRQQPQHQHQPQHQLQHQQQPYYPSNSASQHYSSPSPSVYPIEQPQQSQYLPQHQPPPQYHQPSYTSPPYSHRPSSPPSAPRLTQSSYATQGGYSRPQPGPPSHVGSRNGYHRSSSSLGEEYHQQPPTQPVSYYDGPNSRYQELGPSSIPHGDPQMVRGGGTGGGRYRDEWNNREYRQNQGFAPPSAGPSQGPPTGPYNDGYERNNIRRSYY